MENRGNSCGFMFQQFNYLFLLTVVPLVFFWVVCEGWDRTPFICTRIILVMEVLSMMVQKVVGGVFLAGLHIEGGRNLSLTICNDTILFLLGESRTT